MPAVRVRGGVQALKVVAGRTLAVAITLALAACASRAPDPLTPVATPAPGARVVDLLVTTTRVPEATAGATGMFTGERAGVLHFADIAISIPPAANREVGRVQWPRATPGDPLREFVTRRARDVDGREFDRLLGAAAAANGGRVLVFAHGFNQRFEDAVFGFAQFTADSGAPAAPVLFTWPSRGNVLAYGYDRGSANYSRDAFERVLRRIVAHPAVRDVSVVAHSMGSWLTMETLRQIAIRDRRVPARVTNVMLAAPDLDVDDFRAQLARIGPARPRFTLFVSRDDRALAVSRLVWGSQARLGEVDPASDFVRTCLVRAGIEVVDVTATGAGDGLRHGRFSDSPQVVRYIGGLLSRGHDFGGGPTLTETVTGVAARVTSGVGSTVGAIVTAPIVVFERGAADVVGTQLVDARRSVTGEAGEAGTALCEVP